MQNLIEFLVTSLTPNPQDVEVSVSDTDETTNVNIKVNPSDMGRIIGKEGRTINAIRSIAKILAIKQRKKLSLNLVS